MFNDCKIRLYKTLNPIHIIAGHKTLERIDFTNESGQPLNLIGATCMITISDFATRDVIVNKRCNIYYDDSSALSHKFPDAKFPFTIESVLETLDTVGLEGDYLRQYTLTDYMNERQIPCEGRVIIQKNADPITTDITWFINVDPGGLFATPNKIVLAKDTRAKIVLFYLNNQTQKIAVPPYDHIVFSTDNPAIADITTGTYDAGYVSGNSQGECTITALVSARPEIFTEISVQVVELAYKWYNDVQDNIIHSVPESISLTIGSATMLNFSYKSISSNATLTAPSNDFEFTDYDESIINVSAYGQISAISSGTTNITATAFNNTMITTNIQITIL